MAKARRVRNLGSEFNSRRSQLFSCRKLAQNLGRYRAVHLTELSSDFHKKRISRKAKQKWPALGVQTSRALVAIKTKPRRFLTVCDQRLTVMHLIRIPLPHDVRAHTHPPTHPPTHPHTHTPKHAHRQQSRSLISTQVQPRTLTLLSGLY